MGKVTLVCAPAGFGKTTLLAQWVQTSELTTAWLSIGESDNEMAVFVRSLTAALQSVQEQWEQLEYFLRLLPQEHFQTSPS